MKAMAVVFKDRLKVSFEEVDVPEPGPRDVIVQTRYSWISNGTEGSFLRGERLNGEVPYKEGDPWPFPISMGYQSTGIVTAVGDQVTDIKPGQWVFGTIGKIEGMFLPLSGHISPKVMDRDQVYALPEGCSPVATSGAVLTQVGYNSGSRPPLAIGDTALVIGEGMVGQWAAQTLHWRGAKVILAGWHDDRLKLFANRLGRHVVNNKKENLVEAVRRIAPEGINVLVDTAGSVKTIVECLELFKSNGHIVSTGFNGTESLLDIQLTRVKELTLHSPSGWSRRRMEETITLIANGYLDTESLITHRFPIHKVADAWELIHAFKALGIVLEWPMD